LHLDAGFVTVIGKGNKERVVPVGRKAAAALTRYLDAGRPKLVKPRSTAAVFLHTRGGAFARGTMWRRIKNAVRRAGIERNVTPHMRLASRRTCWNMALTARYPGTPGHASISTTEIPPRGQLTLGRRP